MVNISSWGRLTALPHDVHPITNSSELSTSFTSNIPGLACGMRRSYGDVCLNPGGVLWDMTDLDHFLSFDETTGELECSAGVLLREIQRIFVPRGWLLAVSPGTQFVTVGGAIANDVHGKNHHVMGSFGDHVASVTIHRTNGEMITCGPDVDRPWFEATVGGMGLTGIITRATIRLKPCPSEWLDTDAITYANYDSFISLADDSEKDWEYTVSWIDCSSSSAGRGIFMRANSGPQRQSIWKHRASLSVPMVPPVSLINGTTLRAFNSLYYRSQQSKAGRRRQHYTSFFYPLDNLMHWNRIYGPRGFFQYQMVVPRETGRDATRAMLAAIARERSGSFLAVLKTFGERRSMGMMSFPMPGVTLALDFPNKGQATHRLFANLDAVIRDAGGRIYPAKDARMPKDLFESGYPRLNEFLKFRDPGISSALSRRLIGY